MPVGKAQSMEKAIAIRNDLHHTHHLKVRHGSLGRTNQNFKASCLNPEKSMCDDSRPQRMPAWGAEPAAADTAMVVTEVLKATRT